MLEIARMIDDWLQTKVASIENTTSHFVPNYVKANTDHTQS